MIAQILHKIYQSTVCSPIVSVVILVFYSLLGGLIFRACELDHSLETKTQDWKLKNETYQNFASNFSQWADKIHLEKPKFAIYKQLILESFTDFAIKLGCLTEPNEGEILNDSNWSFAGSIFYAGTLYTTIGYGNYAPQTTGGRVATMIYSLIGIPLVITVLNDMGKVLLGLMRFVSRKLSARFCRVWEKLRERHGKKIKRNRDVSKIEEEGSEDDLPISGALLTFVFWMSTCAGSFMLLEPKWNFFEAFYFAFISLTTIGLGDFTPTDSAKAIVSIPLLLMGLSVISLCINVIQANIGRVFNEFVAAINREYQKKQLGCTSLMESESTMPGATGVKSIVNSLSIRQRMLFKLMDKQKLAFLEDKFEQQAKMRNQQTQTYRLLTSISVQVDDAEAIKAELEKSGSKAMPIEHRNKSYIYNIDD